MKDTNGELYINILREVKMKRNQSIDLLKLISVFLVVVGHNQFSKHFGFIMDASSRFAVPIFFMITGYFVIKSVNISTTLKHQMIKLAKYYITYELVYLAYEFAIALSEMSFSGFNDNLLMYIKYILSAPTIGVHLWYIINIIWVMMIVYIFNKFNKLNVLFIASSILYLIGIIISNLSQQIFQQALPLYATRNFLFFGLFYFMLGMYISKINIDNIKFNNKFILFISVTFCLAQVMEKYLWKVLLGSNFGEYFLTTLFASIGIFIYTLRTNINNKYIKKIASYSMPIYFLHPLMIRVLKLLCSDVFKFNITVITNTIIGNSIFILLVCVFSCLLYYSFKKVKLITTREFIYYRKF